MSDKGYCNVHRIIGSRNTAQTDRQKQDFYATDPKALELLFRFIAIPKNEMIWECCAGLGHLSHKLREMGYEVYASELYERPNALDEHIVFNRDFLAIDNNEYGEWDYHIITNPPFQDSIPFIQRALCLVKDGKYVCMLMPIRDLSGKGRYEIFIQNTPYKIIVFSNRVAYAKDGDFVKHGKLPAMGHAWFVWQKGYTGKCEIEWGIV